MSGDTKPVSGEFAGCWPPGTPGVASAPAKRAPGGQQMRKTTKVIPAPDRNGKRGKAKTVKQPGTPKPRKTSKSVPGGQAQKPRSRKQQGR